jgi:hypothetical protein
MKLLLAIAVLSFVLVSGAAGTVVVMTLHSESAVTN